MYLKITTHKSIILLVILYGCETCSLTLREGHRLRMSENRVLRRLFGPKREKVAESWRRLHNEEFHNLYVSPNIIRLIKSRRMGWAGHVAHIGEMTNEYKILIGKSERKRPRGRPRRIWEDNIRKGLMKTRRECVDWIHLTQDRGQWRELVEHSTEPSGSTKGGEFIGYPSHY
jgi:hypothetical protein